MLADAKSSDGASEIPQSLDLEYLIRREKTDRDRDRQTDRPIYRQTDRQTEIEGDEH